MRFNAEAYEQLFPREKQEVVEETNDDDKMTNSTEEVQETKEEKENVEVKNVKVENIDKVKEQPTDDQTDNEQEKKGE